MSREDSLRSMSFRDLPVRPKMAMSDWLPETEEEKSTECSYNLHYIDGFGEIQTPRFNGDDLKDLIQNFETRDDDVYVCTYPKSGTTWTQQIITLLLNNGVQGEKTYAEVVPWMESLVYTSTVGPEAVNCTLEKIKSTPNRRFMKSHANLKELPVGRAKGLKVVYVARNPKDVCISLYHHAINKPEHGFRGNLRYMIRCFAQGRCYGGSWFNHVLEWWEAARADPDHVLFLRYEDMLKTPEEHIRKIADFVGIPHTPDVIAKTTAASAFSAMKNNPKANTRSKDNHLRKGGAGGWRDSWTVRESEEFNKIYREQMAGSGLDFDFGEVGSFKLEQ
ncbi:unnamed protein product [Ascophyllum nodosum]